MILTEHLTKRFGGLTAVHDLNLDIPQGQCFAFLGPNGAGKTTTIKLLAGLLKPTSGRALVGGHDIQKDPVAARKLIGFVPDMPFLYDKLDPVEFMLFIGQLYGMRRGEVEPAIDELFDVFDLNETRKQIIENLSHGTRQRLVIASALLHEPKVIIIDEPMVGLDPRSARVVKNVLKQRSRAGVTVFLSTHILSIAEELADRIGILNRGKLIATGTIDQLREMSGEVGALEDAFLALTPEEEEEGATREAP
ncbi:MAG TPA: ABC transporter ATP-binding protein [Verrucomicrobiae bacterium]|nr:ABC transporter ATP-binding protein [Verrucomicrobiae bacterium]